jgi:hypothetical protein
MFWGSGLLKDGILIGGFGLCLYSFVLIVRNGITAKRLIGFLVGILVLFITKVYVIAIILPGIFAWWITRNSNGTKTILTFLFTYIIYLSIGFNLYRLDPDTNLAAELFYKQKNFIELADMHSATTIAFPRIECSGVSVLLKSPHAFTNTLFRPFLTDSPGNPLILMASFENMLILIIMLLCIFSFNRKNKRTDPFILFNLTFIILLFVLIGLSSPVLGAIVRYKIIALPSLMFVFIYYSDIDLMLKRFSFLSFLAKIRS